MVCTNVRFNVVYKRAMRDPHEAGIRARDAVVAKGEQAPCFLGRAGHIGQAQAACL
jgi:hypothetical protein